MSFPTHARVVVIGAGIHGLSTAWRLAERLRAAGKGNGADILVLDKTAIAAGASGIACGVIRNNYFQPAMRELMAHSVDVWETDPKGFSYHPVGYMQISHEAMREDVTGIYEQQKEIGYSSEFIEGEKDCMAYMKGLLSDWRAEGITSVLHEKKGGYANNTAAIYGLAGKAEAHGVRIMTGVTVTGFERGSNSDAVTGVVTDRGTVKCDRVVVAVGPWVKTIWGQCSTCRARCRSRGPTAGCTTASRPGATGAWRRASSASIPTCSGSTTAACRRSSMSTPMRRCGPTSTGRSSPRSRGASTTSRISISTASRAAPCPTR